MPDNLNLNHDLQRVKRETIDFSGDYADGSHFRLQIIYAAYFMPAQIMKQFINDSNLQSFSEFKNQQEESISLKEKWDKEIAVKQKEVEQLQQKLEEQKAGFNFVGLYKGFSQLVEAKKNEAKWIFYSLIAMGFIALVPLSVEVVVALTALYNAEPLSSSHLFVLIPLLSIEAILIYFFRVILLNYRSVKAQIMQIELRQTLCQFIQSYADYSSEIKEKDHAALDKFENLIFSGILSDPEKLPSTFDGLEQIGNLIKNIKN